MSYVHYVIIIITRVFKKTLIYEEIMIRTEDYSLSPQLPLPTHFLLSLFPFYFLLLDFITIVKMGCEIELDRVLGELRPIVSSESLHVLHMFRLYIFYDGFKMSYRQLKIFWGKVRSVLLM